MIKDSEYCSKVIETQFNNPLVMTEKDHEDFKNPTKCWICKKEYEKGKVKVKNHNHINGKYRGTGNQEYNLKPILTKKVLVVFHNLLNYDSH